MNSLLKKVNKDRSFRNLNLDLDAEEYTLNKPMAKEIEK